MGNTKTESNKQTNEKNKSSQTQTAAGEVEEGEEGQMYSDRGDLTLNGEHTMQHTEDE